MTTLMYERATRTSPTKVPHPAAWLRAMRRLFGPGWRMHRRFAKRRWQLKVAAAGILLSLVPASAKAYSAGDPCLAQGTVQAIGQVPCASGQVCDTPGSSSSATAQACPNIAIILLDDAGFAATSMFGGMAQTPAFESLARTGLRYNEFHVAAICAPTRAALLTGRNPHQVGFGQIPELATNNPGYNTILPKSAASIAENLKSLGYGTAAFGKWHNTPAWEWSPVGPFDRWPTGLGFQYFYGTMGTTDTWEPLLWRNTITVEPKLKAEQGYNLTTDLVDDAIQWLHTRQTLAPDKAYFMYFATTATHSPHQVAKKWIDPYRGKFNAGWDTLRESIFAREKALGVVPPEAVLTPRDTGLPAWSSLSPDEKTVAERQMEILAGYMSQTDYEIGRLIQAIRQAPDGENTLIFLIAGDNGASGDEGIKGCDDCPQTPPPAKVRMTYLDELAGPKYLSESDAAWAFMNDTPFPGMKRDASTLGGTTDPLIVSWPGHTTSDDVVRSQYLNVTDIAATIYDVLGFAPPSTVDGVAQIPLAGTSFAASFNSPKAPSTHQIQYFESFGNRAIYEDGWMASLRYVTPWDLKSARESSDSPEGTAGWQLYHLNEDFSQSHDIAKLYPERLQQMVALFDSEAKRNQVYPITGVHTWYEEMPSLTWRRTDFTYYPDLPILVWDAVPDFSRAHRITARVYLPNDRATGLVMSSGMRGRGFALYMKDGGLIYEAEQINRSSPIRTAQRLLRGEHEIVVDVSAGKFGGSGTRHVRIYLDGKLVSQGEVPESTEPFYGASTLSIGTQRDSPVSPSLPPPFSGTIHTVQVHFTISDSPEAAPVDQRHRGRVE
jgi:arylsulfatase A-like enzyme